MRDKTLLLDQFPELLYLLDDASKTYPGRAALLIEVPYRILEVAGGRFTEEEVREIVKRHLPSGHYPLIRYIGPQVQVEEIKSTLGAGEGLQGLSITWKELEDLDFEYYRIYTSPTKDGPWTLAEELGSSEASTIIPVAVGTYFVYAVHVIKIENTLYEGLRSKIYQVTHWLQS